MAETWLLVVAACLFVSLILIPAFFAFVWVVRRIQEKRFMRGLDPRRNGGKSKNR